jgi:hypothetical protein
MIDYTLFGFTLAILLVGVWYAVTMTNISGEDDVEDDGRGNPPRASIIGFRRGQRTATGKRKKPR